MSTKLKFEIVDDILHSHSDSLDPEEPGFLPKSNFEIVLIEFDHRQYEVVGMRSGICNEEGIDNILKYYLKELKP